MPGTSIKVESGNTPPTKEQIERAAEAAHMKDNNIRISDELFTILRKKYPNDMSLEEALIKYYKDHPPRN